MQLKLHLLAVSTELHVKKPILKQIKKIIRLKGLLAKP